MTTTNDTPGAGLTRLTIATVTDTRGIDDEPYTGVITHAAAEQLVEQLEALEHQHVEGSPGITLYVTYRHSDGGPAHSGHLIAPSALDTITQQLKAMACC